MSALEACQDLFVKSVEPALNSKTVPNKIKRALACKYVCLLCDSRQLVRQKKERFGVRWYVTEESVRRQYEEVAGMIKQIVQKKNHKQQSIVNGEKSHVKDNGNRGSNQRH